MEKNKRPGVIVLGGHVQGLGIIRIFGKNKIPCILLDDTDINIARHSKYCLKFYKYKTHDLFSYLISFSIYKQYRDWLLLPTNDYQVEVLSQNKSELTKYFRVGVDSWEVVKKCYNKKLTYQVAMDCDIKIAHTNFPENIGDIENFETNFPCIIKPAVMYKFYSKIKKKVLKCNNVTELIENYKLALKLIPAEEIIIQEVIPGDNENQFSACFLYNGNKPLVSLVARRKRQHPLEFGNATTFAETIFSDKIIDLSTKILNEIGYHGICEVEFKYDHRDESYKFLEINPRTWKWHSISEKSDSPFLISIYNLIYNNEKTIKNTWNHAGFRHLITDVPTIFRLLLKGNFKSTKIDNIKYAVWSIDDLKPAIFELLYLPFFIKNR